MKEGWAGVGEWKREGREQGTHKIVPEKIPIGAPRFSVSQTSAIVPPTLHMGAEAARPAIIRGTMSVPATWARALGRVNMK